MRSDAVLKAADAANDVLPELRIRQHSASEGAESKDFPNCNCRCKAGWAEVSASLALY